MIDDDKALVERLRSGKWLGETTCGPAADRIEAQAERVKAMEEALERSREGWENAIELGLIPERHRNTALILAEDCRAALRTARETNDA